MKRWRLAAAGVIVVSCVACTTYDFHDSAPIFSAVLTGSDPYIMTSAPGTASFVSRVPDNNTREMFWPSDSPPVSNSESCATWATETNANVQQGAALRIRHVTGGYQLVTVTKNIWGYAYWIFNFHVWDPTRTPPYTQVGQVNLASEFETAANEAFPPPWYMCARVSGSTLQFKAWRLGQSEPAYGDPHYGAAVTLPAGWDYPGATGWYIGHAPTNNEASFTDLVTRSP